MPQLEARRGSETARRLLFADEPDPRALQAVFVLLFGLDLALRSVGGAGFRVSSWPAVGCVLVLFALAVAVVVPWPRVPAWAVGVLPVIDFAALGMSRLDTLSSGAGLIAVVPALWLGRQFGRRGAATAVASAMALLVLPALVYFGINGITLSRSLLLVVAVGWSALAIATALERVRAGWDEAERGRAELASALETARAATRP